MTSEFELPMFPLGAVVFPAQHIPLRVFEPRYLRLVDDIIEEVVEGFGITLIERGHEVGGGDTRSHVGTQMKIDQLDGSFAAGWSLGAIGHERITVLEWLEDDPYPRARVETSPIQANAQSEVEQAIDMTIDDLEAAFVATWRMAISSDAPGISLDAVDIPLPEVDNLDDRIGLLCAHAPLTSYDRQTLLGANSTIERTHELIEALAHKRTSLNP